ncbi:hypothetical protein B9T19_07620 [Ignatzschineria sp. F8392]|uniref:hypothetical protein n=1 Tax=Ignatzschineria sp. F8392 TaxID=1980117 RepID=UPI000B987F34|nr:hypothetical protein [Ignatzschineria sp. F8392]OYQ78707.1 hypothetical protein B9T19_07620 [Ignatzschineria sp. F8392]
MVKDHSEDTQNNNSVEPIPINQKLDSIIDLLKIIAANGLSSMGKDQPPSIDSSYSQDEKGYRSLRTFFKLDKQLINSQDQTKIIQLEDTITQLKSDYKIKESEQQNIIAELEHNIRKLQQDYAVERERLYTEHENILQKYKQKNQNLESDIFIKSKYIDELKENYNDLLNKKNNLLKINTDLYNKIKNLNKALENSYQLPGIQTTIDNFKSVFNDPDLMNIFALDGKDNQTGIELIRFIAKAAQWNDVQKVWDHLAKKCKSENREATSVEISLLKEIVKIHNLIYRDKSATLYIASRGDRYDYKQMQRGNNASSGDTVTEIWLPGLKNPAQGVEKPVLVNTD